jgi:hypothetical protein
MLADDQRDCVNVDECSLSVHDCHPKALCTGELANVCECRSDLYVLACRVRVITYVYARQWVPTYVHSSRMCELEFDKFYLLHLLSQDVCFLRDLIGAMPK